MKYIKLLIIILVFATSCNSAKQTLKHVIAPKDSIQLIVNKSLDSSTAYKTNVLKKMLENQLDYKDFTAKIKVDSEGGNGKNPDINAIVKIKKDSAIWISLTASLINFEVYRLYITPNEVTVLDKREKTYQVRNMDYLKEVTGIPISFKTLQDALIGNILFFDINNAQVKKEDNSIIITSVKNDFKNITRISDYDYLIENTKLDDVDVNKHRSCNFQYTDYALLKNSKFFSTIRDITVSEKSVLKIRLNFKQFDFDTNVNFNFNIPQNYTKK